MAQVRIYQMDAFTHLPFGGNPAGVVLDADGLTDAQMQKIAREINCAETAFVLSSQQKGADLRVRFFTPTEEIDLCGHATIASFVALGMEERLGRQLPVTLVQETKAGLLPVMISRDREDRIQVMMTQTAPVFYECDIERAEMARLLGLDVSDIDSDLPMGLAYTGVLDMQVPIKSLEAFARMRPDLNGLAKINRSLNVVSTHCYSFETLYPDSQLHARDFAPSYGIPEDPATGTANGALGAYLLHHGVLTPHQEQVHLQVEQGFEIDRASFIQVIVDGEPRSPRTVRVGGTAVSILQGVMAF